MTELEDALEVVFLCTGNRFRSPLAAAVFADAAAGKPVRVRSLGTLELGAVPALPEAVHHATRFGLDIGAHHATALQSGDLAQADLVVGFERGHVATAVVDGGAAQERVFTLPELVELLERVAPPSAGEPVARARAAIAGAAATRADPRTAAIPKLEDPLGLPPARQRQIAERLHELTRRLARQLFE